MEENVIISLQGVSKSFGSKLVVDNFNLDIHQGEFVTFLGPSGCGKTTTLRMIAGFETATTGKILLNGKDITKIPPNKRPINTVFQRYALFPYLDVYDNIAFGLKLKKIPLKVIDKQGNPVIDKKTGLQKIKMVHLSKQEIDDRVHRVLRVIDLEELENRDISTLSGGQQQRVAMARAIVNQPQILLLDEPLAALDLKLRKEMQLELKEMHKKLGITFIYVTHDQEEALTMSDKIVVMKKGEIQQVGTPIDIYNEPVNAYVANFIGESNIYNATMVDKKKVKFLSHVFSCVDNFPINEKVDVVIRPEDVILKKVINGPREGVLTGKIISKIFKGMHYEYVISVGKSEVIAQDTKERKVDDLVSIDVLAENIQIMKKELTANVYPEAWIDKNNNVVISENPFECDVSQLVDGGHLDEEGYVISKEGKKYDFKDADVLAEVSLNDVEAVDGFDNGNINAIIISSIYIGDHYQVIARTALHEDFIFETQYLYNINDQVSLSIKKDKFKLTIKGDISKYEIE